jgi:hypothetical protein
VVLGYRRDHGARRVPTVPHVISQWACDKPDTRLTTTSPETRRVEPVATQHQHRANRSVHAHVAAACSGWLAPWQAAAASLLTASLGRGNSFSPGTLRAVAAASAASTALACIAALVSAGVA